MVTNDQLNGLVGSRALLTFASQRTVTAKLVGFDRDFIYVSEDMRSSTYRRQGLVSIKPESGETP